MKVGAWYHDSLYVRYYTRVCILGVISFKLTIAIKQLGSQCEQTSLDRGPIDLLLVLDAYCRQFNHHICRMCLGILVQLWTGYHLSYQGINN